ncbi:MAG: TraR/DksA family transcriptional regulator [Parvularcula sp.]
MDIEKYKKLLTDRLAELTGRVHEIEEELDEPVSKNWDEAAIEREDDEVLESLGNTSLNEVRAIRAALDRIKAGTYGICTVCGDEISPERLDAVPWAATCRKCAA